MRRTRFRAPIVGLLTAVTVSLGAGPGMLAQSPSTQGNGHGKAGVRQSLDNQGNGQYKGPGIKGKMGSTKNSERWAAAIRNADLRAAKIRNDHGKANGKGK